MITADSIRQALKCDNPACVCHKPNGMVHCPTHADSNPSLSVTERDGKILFKDFGGCSQDRVIAALRDKGLWPSGNGNSQNNWGLTLKELADAKRLPVDSLKRWGVADINYKGRQSVYIPYRDLEGKITDRFRLNLKQEPRLIWRKGAKTILYGLWRPVEFQQGSWILIVEGETDCWTLWHHNIPAIGLPGKNTWRREWAEYFQGLKIYLWQEPDAPELPEKVARDVPALLVIKAPAAFKDISEAQIAGEDVMALIKKLKGEAKPPEMPLPTPPQGNSPWVVAAQLFPRIPFPWEVLPSGIGDSLQQLGRACATSPYALPGAAFCMVGSIMGRTVVVSPKEGWEAPLIIWHMDIRGSGDGKTPPVRLMARPIHEAQRHEEICYREAMDAYKRLSRKERDQQPPPAPPRGYFVSDLTLEGLRDDLVNSPHGGILGIHDEISAFLSAQNQYKPKGTDREAWLLLYDGHSSRIVRAGRTVYLDGARVSIFGGVQPRVFKTFFAGEDGLYLEDGTLYRFLATCEPSTYYDLTPESWGDLDRAKWETVLHRAMAWVDEKIYVNGGQIEKPTLMILDSEAQTKFFEWRNHIYSFKDQFPAQLRGFLPKAIEYVLRLTGVIHCMRVFSIGSTPQLVLSLEDLERGIKVVSFYLGQIQGALRLIEEDDYSPPEISERSLLLAQTLERLRPHLENGRLAVGFIHEQYNLITTRTQKIGTSRGMGAVLRAVQLTIAPGKHNANGRRAAKCLAWDKNTETFIEQCLRSLQCHNGKEWQGFEDVDIEEAMSASSADTAGGFENLKDFRNKIYSPETSTTNEPQDNADIADMMEVEF